MKYLHTMVRVTDVDASLAFFSALGLQELRRYDNEAGRFTLIFLAAPGDESAQVELTYNWDPETLSGGRNFGHLAYAVDDIYALCKHLMDQGITINRPQVRNAFRSLMSRRAARSTGTGSPLGTSGTRSEWGSRSSAVMWIRSFCLKL